MKRINIIHNTVLIFFMSVIYMPLSMVLIPTQRYISLHFLLITFGYLAQSLYLKLKRLKPFAFTTSYEANGAWVGRSFLPIVLCFLSSFPIAQVCTVELVTKRLSLILPISLFAYGSVIYFIVIFGAFLIGIYTANYTAAYFGKPVFSYTASLAYVLLMIFTLVTFGKYVDFFVYIKTTVLLIVCAGVLIMYYSNALMYFSASKYGDTNDIFSFDLFSLMMYTGIVAFMLTVVGCLFILLNGIAVLIGFGDGSVFDLISAAITIIFIIALAAVVISAKYRTAVIIGRILRTVSYFLSILLEDILKLLGLEPLFKSRRRPYTETVRRVQDAEIAEYHTANRRARSYPDFLVALSMYDDLDQKIGYAYRTLCELYRRKSPNIKRSDTPNEVKDKADNAVIGNTGQIRDIIEKVKFMTDECTQKEKEEMLNKLCIEVRKHFR